MSEAQTPEQTLIEQYEIGDETSVVETPVETAIPPSVETAPVSRDDKGRFVATPETSTPSHPAYLVRMAKNVGFSDEEIQGIPPEALGLAVAHVQETQRQNTIEATHHEAVDKARQTDSPTPQREDPFELPTEEYDDKLVNVLKRLDRENKQLRAEMIQLRNFEAARQTETLTQKIDRLFDSQPEERFGKGPGKKLAKDAPEMKRRLAVLREMETLGQGDIEDHFSKAVETIYGKAAPAKIPPPDKELEERKEQWTRGGVSRPTHRNGAAEPNGTAKAERSVAEALKEMGEGAEVSTSLDDFLG